MVGVGVVDSIYGVYWKVSMVGFAEEGARVVDKKKVAPSTFVVEKSSMVTTSVRAPAEA